MIKMEETFFDRYVNQGEIINPLKDYKRTKHAELFRRVAKLFSGPASTIMTYNDWIENILPTQISAQNFERTSPEGHLWKVVFSSPENKPLLSKPHFGGRPVTPMWCRQNSYPYSSDLTINVKVYRKTKKDTEFKLIKNIDKVLEMAIPVMLGSKLCRLYNLTPEELVKQGECPFDPFGYFIIKSERSVITQDKLRFQLPITIYNPKTGRKECRYTSLGKKMTKILTLTTGKKYRTIKVMSLSFLSRTNKDENDAEHDELDPSRDAKSLPLFIIFRILHDPRIGDRKVDESKVLDDILEKYILSFADDKFKILLRSILYPSMFKSATIEDENVVPYIAGKKNDAYNAKNFLIWRDNYRKKIIEDLFYDIDTSLENVRNEEDLVERKLYQLGYMTYRFALILSGYRELDSRDTWANKKFDTAANSMHLLFNNVFSKFVENAIESISDGNFEDFPSKLEAKKRNQSLRAQFESSFNTKWGAVNSQKKETIAEQTKRDTPIALWAQTSKKNSGSSRRNKKPDIRDVQGSQFDYTCPVETPEGENVGLVKYASVTCVMTLKRSGLPIYLLANEYKNKGEFIITINGKLVVIDGTPKKVDEDFSFYVRDARRQGEVSPYTEIYTDKIIKSIEIYTDGGRPTAPYLIVENNQLMIDRLNMWEESFENLLKMKCIEFISPRECENDYICVASSVEKFYKTFQTTNYSHCKIEPSQQFSLTASTCPYINHQPGNRSSYQCGMVKQALGYYNTNYHLMFSASFKRLERAERAVCETDTMFIPGLDIMPSGQTANILFAADPDNQEDAVVISEDFVNSGKLNYTVYHTIIYTKPKVAEGKELVFCKPQLGPSEDPAYYAAIGDDGMPILDRYVRGGDCVIGIESVDGMTGKRVNISKYADSLEQGYIDRVLITTNKTEHSLMIKIKLRQKRTYKAGDKLALRYAQKGTIGRVAKYTELPVVAEGPCKGMRPEVVFNPHGFPTRQTIGLEIEGIKNEEALYKGVRSDASAFRPRDIKETENFLESLGLNKYGYKKMLFPNGLVRDMVMLPLYEQALKHHVDDKIQARGLRASGSISVSTRQPVKGRKNGGGLRIGEMEKDAMAAHGASNLIRERMLLVSDLFELIVCRDCGLPMIVENISRIEFVCKSCNKTNAGIIEIPFPFKTLIQLLNASNIDVRLYTQ